MSPIRSNRGRSAVWRAVLAWPLHSRARAIITSVVVVLVLVAVGRASALWRDGDNHQAAPPPSATAQPSTPTHNSDPDRPAATEPLPVPAGRVSAMGQPAPQDALRAATGFLRNWAHHPDGITATKWADNLAEYAMPELVGRMYSTEPGNVPATRLIGDLEVTRVTDAVVEARQRTDGPTVTVTVIHPLGRWKVNRVGVAP